MSDARPNLTLTEIVLDAPDAHELAEFYVRLLGEPIAIDESDWVTIRSATGPTLAFATEPAYVTPVWPSESTAQQMMLHLDFLVDDLDRAVAHAVEAGATVASYQPQQDVRVMLDPAGHPFCLWVEPSR